MTRHALHDVRVVRLVAFAIGCLIGATAGLAGWRWLCAVVLGDLLSVAGASGSTVRRALLAAAVGLGCAGAAAVWHRHELTVGPIAAGARSHADVTVIARAVRDPVQVGAPDRKLELLDATVTRLIAGGSSVAADSPVIIFGYGVTWARVQPDQRLRVSGRLQPPRDGDFVTAVLDASSAPGLIGGLPWWQRWSDRLRKNLASACDRLPVNERSLVPALVLGVVTPLPSRLKTQFQVTGLSHLVAVSGENLAIVVGAISALGLRLGWRRRTRITVGALTIIGFVVVARPSPSVLRAAVMGGLVLLATAVGRRANPLPILALSVSALVLINPFLVRDVGFGLSVAATAGLLLLTEPLSTRLRCRLPAALADAIAIPLAAQLACTPILMLAFGQLTPYAVPANLLAGIAVAPATIIGVGVALISLASSALAGLLAYVAALPAAWIVMVARLFAALPGAGLQAAGTPRLLLLAGLAIAVATTLRRPHSHVRS